MLEVAFNAVAAFFSNLTASLLSLVKIMLRSRWGVRLPAAGQPRCSVLGNGPSLTDSLANHPDFLSGTELICVNNFAHADDFIQLQPSNYVVADPNYFVFTEHTTDRDDIRRTLLILSERVSWTMRLYVPHFAKGSYVVTTIERANPLVRVVYFNPTVVRGFARFRHYMYATNLGMPQAQTVIVTALSLMINRGFREIFLFGADTSWHEQIRLDDQNQLLMKQLHFYDKPKDVAFVPVYSDAQRTQTFTMASQFLSLHKVFAGYEVVRDYANYKAVRILNASSKSYIDAFERVQLGQTVDQ